jgi:hypothetical protein
LTFLGGEALHEPDHPPPVAVALLQNNHAAEFLRGMLVRRPCQEHEPYQSPVGRALYNPMRRVAVLECRGMSRSLPGEG